MQVGTLLKRPLIGLLVNCKSDWIDKIDRIIELSSHHINPTSLVYFSLLPFDQKKISSMLKVTKWPVLEYDPKLLASDEKLIGYHEFLRVIAELPGDSRKLNLAFACSRETAKSAIAINPKGGIDEKLIQVVKPTKFLRVIGDVWESE